MDSFYASVEVRDNPALIGKPVVIGSDPQQGKGRGVVSTCSYEARGYGLHSGMPISQAWSLCPHAVYIKPSGKYGIASVQIMNIIQEFTGELEQVSIDEAYLNLSPCNSWGDAEELAQKIKQEIMLRERLTCSIGIAPARSYAKIASEIKKPDGLVVITPEILHSVIDPLPASRIPGIGRKSSSYLQAQGIITVKDLADTDIQRLQDIFGKYAIRIHTIASGHDTSGLKDQGPRQSIGRETTFTADTTDLFLITTTFQDLVSSLISELARKRARCRTVGVRIRYTGFITQTRSVTRAKADNNEAYILKTVLSLFTEYWTGEPVRLVGIRLSGLSYQDHVQSVLDRFIPM